jgi:predicted P-loop ATPase
MVTSNHASNGQNRFTISDYIDYLEPNPKDKTKYFCPICNQPNLSIHKDGEQYNCFNGCLSNEVSYVLREKAGTLKQKQSSPNNYNTDSSKKTSTKTKNKSQDKERLRMTHQQDVTEFIRDKYGDTISYNVRTDEIEISGHPLKLDIVRPIIADKYGIDINNDLLTRTFLYLAYKQQYDPVMDYLTRCKLVTGLELDKTISKLINSENELHITMMRKFLIGSVARVYRPGCKMDVALIFVSSQGFGKSSFLRTISNEYFSDAMTGKLDTNDLRVMNKHWFLEWSELDVVTAKDYHSTIKPFLSRQEDTYRIPYARDMITKPRRSVITGTTNRDDFLKDPTGERRHWVVPISTPFDLNFVEKIRDSLWSSVISAYEDGEDWNLPQRLWKAQAEDSENYRQIDLWEDILIPYLQSRTEFGVEIQDLIKKLESQGIPVSYSKNEQMRCTDILKREGWSKKQVRINGRRVSLWTKN